MLFIFVLIFSLLFGNFALSQEQRQMTKEEQEMMNLWQEYATPGRPHENFKYFEGLWNGDLKMWMAPEVSPSISKGKAKGEVIMGGRYLIMKYESTFEGMKFEGMSILAYDNARKKFQSFWIDNFGTGIYPLEGTCSNDFKECIDEGEWYDPIKKKNYKVKIITKKINDDSFRNEMFITYPNEKQFKSMESIYTREK